MSVRLNVNQGIGILATQLTSEVTELDLTNCFLLQREELVPQIWKCASLRCLRCKGCALLPSDMFTLMLKRLPLLVAVEFSLLFEMDADAELEQMRAIESLTDGGSMMPMLGRMYVEVGGKRNFKFLSKLLYFCPNLRNLQVHFVRGTFTEAVQECRVILAQRVGLEIFTFTSEVSGHYQPEATMQFDLTGYAGLCANVSHCVSTNLWSCIRLRDIVSCEPRTLPPQVTIVAVDFERGLTAEAIRMATDRNEWRHVRSLCLLLFPEDLFSIEYPTAGGTYRYSLLYLFSVAIRHIAELNVSSFHFAPDLDLTELIGQGSLMYLQSLSASPCALSRPGSLGRLARSCPDISELDLRTETNGRFRRCAGCDRELFDGRSYGHTRPEFRRGLTRLTLSRVHYQTCARFIACSAAAGAVRFFDCCTPSYRNYARLVQELPSALTCLVLHDMHLDFTDPRLLANLSCLVSLKFLYLLSALARMDDLISRTMATLTSRQPRLMFVHVHYQSCVAVGLQKRLTWVRRVDTPIGGPFLLLDSPCFGGCSTATFIGLAKPLNRDFEANI